MNGVPYHHTQYSGFSRFDVQVTNSNMFGFDTQIWDDDENLIKLSNSSLLSSFAREPPLLYYTWTWWPSIGCEMKKKSGQLDGIASGGGVADRLLF